MTITKSEMMNYIIGDTQEEKEERFQEIFEEWGNETGGIDLIVNEYNFFKSNKGYIQFAGWLDDSINDI